MNKIDEKKYIESYKSYLLDLSIKEDIKSVLINDKLIDRNPKFYLYYPALFYSGKDENALKQLSIAGYLFYLSTLFLDDVIDNNNNKKIILSLTTQEESIKLLTHLFGLESQFWELWQQRRSEYFKAVILEAAIKQKETVSFEEYGKIAAYKSAFGKAAVDSVYILSNKKDFSSKKTKAIQKSHDLFSVAFQLNDDIQDFKEDFANEQFNWAYYEMQKNNDVAEDIDIVYKHFYIKGYASKVMLIAIEYLEKAIDEVKSFEVPLWVTLLNDTKRKFQNAIFEIDNYLETLNAEVNLSNNYAKKTSIENSITKGINHISINQKENGSWREYINQGGISSTWSTAFILSHISDSEISYTLSREIKRGVNYIFKTKKTNIWGYNSTWINDSDSTSFAFLSLHLNNEKIEQDSYNEWIKFQRKDGSFSTYKNKKHLISTLNDPRINNVDGWTSSHHCVSAVSLFYLLKSNSNSSALDKLKSFFNNLNIKDINAYWWTSPIYTYYYLAKSCVLMNDNTRLKEILNQVKSLANEDGSFSDSYGTNLFYSGLALEILSLDIDNTLETAEKTSQFLISNQYSDGSWANSYALQVPEAKDTVPKKLPFKISKSGMDVRAKEFNRLFTTTIITKSLAHYAKAQTRS